MRGTYQCAQKQTISGSCLRFPYLNAAFRFGLLTLLETWKEPLLVQQLLVDDLLLRSGCECSRAVELLLAFDADRVFWSGSLIRPGPRAVNSDCRWRTRL